MVDAAQDPDLAIANVVVSIVACLVDDLTRYLHTGAPVPREVDRTVCARAELSWQDLPIGHSRYGAQCFVFQTVVACLSKLDRGNVWQIQPIAVR